MQFAPDRPAPRSDRRSVPREGWSEGWLDGEMSGAPPPAGSWRGRPPLSLRFGDPGRLFARLARWLAPAAPLRHVIPPAVALAGTAAAFNWLELQTHLARIGLTMTFLQGFLVGLVITNLMAKLTQGIVMAAHGAFCDEIGFRLAFGVIPKFYIFKGAIRSLGLREQRVCYAAPLLFRLAVFALGVLTWIILLPSGSGLADFALPVGMAGLSSFLFTANPLFPADGYRWLAARLERPRLRVHGLRVLGMVLTFRPIPAALPRSEFWLLLLFGLTSLVFTAFVVFSAIIMIALLLEEELRGTGVVIFCLMFAAMVTFFVSLADRRSGRGGRSRPQGG
jgi:hypothetical protein